MEENTPVNKPEGTQSKDISKLGSSEVAEQEVNTKNADKQFSDMAKGKTE